MSDEPGPGAIDPYRFYVNEVEPDVSELDGLKGTIEYFDLYDTIVKDIESKREHYLTFLPGMMIGTAMLKIIFDYYDSLSYEPKDTDGTEIDDKYNIDLIALKENEVVVVQVKSGEISGSEMKKFCTRAPEYIIEHQSDKKIKKLIVLAYKLDENANELLTDYGKEMLKEGFILDRLFPEAVMKEIPKYRRHFKELAKIHVK